VISFGQTSLSCGHTSPLKKGVEGKLKKFFYYKRERERERERESEFTQGFGWEIGKVASLSLMGIILPYWGRVRQEGG